MKSHNSLSGMFFVYNLGLSMPIFKEKIFHETSWKKFQTFHFSNVTAMKSLKLFPRRFGKDFFLKIGIPNAMANTENVLNIEEYDFIPGPVKTSSIKQVIVVLYK